MNSENKFKNLPLIWEEVHIEDGSDLFIYKSNWNEHELLLRINDFPDEPLYTFFLDKQPEFDIDDFSENWVKKDNKNS